MISIMKGMRFNAWTLGVRDWNSVQLATSFALRNVSYVAKSRENEVEDYFHIIV